MTKDTDYIEPIVHMEDTKVHENIVQDMPDNRKNWFMERTMFFHQQLFYFILFFAIIFYFAGYSILLIL